MINKRGLFFLICLCASTARAEFLVGYFNHPQIEIYKHLVSQAYTDIGIDITLVEVTMERGLIALNDGLLDADVIRAIHAQEVYDNIIVTSVVLTHAQTHLICQRQLICEQSVFRKPRNDIYINLAASYSLEQQINTPLKANLVVYDKVDTLLSMMLDKRILYAVYHSDESGLPPLITNQFNSVKIIEYETYHVLNKRHAGLKDKLDTALTLRLAELKQSNLLKRSVVDPS